VNHMTTVVKVGGSLIEEGWLQSVLTDVRNTLSTEEAVLVHGGGQKVTEIAERLGKQQRFVTSPSGVRSRYTDSETAEIYSMVMSGLVAGRIVTGFAKLGVRAFSLSGIDASCIIAERKRRLLIINERGRKMAIEGGFTGKVTSVDSSILRWILGLGLLPVVSPVAIGGEGEILNIDGDRAASAIASSLPADTLLILTNVEGVVLRGKTVPHLSCNEARSLLPEIGPGMDKKVIASVEAVQNGVKRSIIAPGNRSKAIADAIRLKCGTVIEDG
jgi:acetylglutamate/LysW-gamma-L-alpha-aminoadipate kinase